MPETHFSIVVASSLLPFEHFSCVYDHLLLEITVGLNFKQAIGGEPVAFIIAFVNPIVKWLTSCLLALIIMGQIA